jgi:hypothetical protein
LGAPDSTNPSFYERAYYARYSVVGCTQLHMRWNSTRVVLALILVTLGVGNANGNARSVGSCWVADSPARGAHDSNHQPCVVPTCTVVAPSPPLGAVCDEQLVLRTQEVSIWSVRSSRPCRLRRVVITAGDRDRWGLAWQRAELALFGRSRLSSQSIPPLDRLRESFCCRQVRERVGIR